MCDVLCVLIRSFRTICFVFCVLFVICTFCAHNTLYTCLYYLLPPCCFGCVFLGFFSSSNPWQFYRSAARPPPQTTDCGFHSAAPHFCHQVASPLSGRCPRGLIIKGKCTDSTLSNLTSTLNPYC